MKKLRITVNSKAYDVVVEVLEDDEQKAAGSTYLSPLPPVAASPRPVVAPEAAHPVAPASGVTPPAPGPAAAASPTPAPVAPISAPEAASSAPPPEASSPPASPSSEPRRTEPHVVVAPVAGTVKKVFVEPGAVFDARSPVVLLDAMMMDTPVYAPTGGLVAVVAVAPGRIVQAGDPLIRYVG
jgi:biotin carboxyl carrier protein